MVENSQGYLLKDKKHSRIQELRKTVKEMSYLNEDVKIIINPRDPSLFNRSSYHPFYLGRESKKALMEDLADAGEVVAYIGNGEERVLYHWAREISSRSLTEKTRD